MRYHRVPRIHLGQRKIMDRQMDRQFDAASLLGVGTPLDLTLPPLHDEHEFVIRLNRYSVSEIVHHPFLHRFIRCGDFDDYGSLPTGDYYLRLVDYSKVSYWESRGFKIASVHVAIAFALCRYVKGYAEAIKNPDLFHRVLDPFVCFDTQHNYPLYMGLLDLETRHSNTSFCARLDTYIPSFHARYQRLMMSRR